MHISKSHVLVWQIIVNHSEVKFCRNNLQFTVIVKLMKTLDYQTINYLSKHELKYISHHTKYDNIVFKAHSLYIVP